MSERGRLSLLIHFAFLLTGIVTTILGPLLPFLVSRWSLSDAEAGSLFSLQSGGSLLGIALSTYLTPRAGFVRTLALGAGLMATGMTGLALGSQVLGMASIPVYGIGLGIMIPGVNVLSTALNPSRRAAALNLLNSLWCTGALLGPGLVAVASERDALPAFFGTLVLLLVVTTLWYWFEASGGCADLGRVGPRVSVDEAPPERRGISAWLIGVLLFLYVGVETATWGWIATYARRLGVSEGEWALLQSVFWLTLLAGRLVSPLVLRHTEGTKLVLASLVLVLAGTSELILVSQIGPLMVGAAMAGAGMSCIYPTSVAGYTDRYGSRNSRASGVVFALASLGGAVIPWAVGFLSDFSGNLRAGMLIPVVASCAMIGIQIILVRTRPRLLTRSATPA